MEIEPVLKVLFEYLRDALYNSENAALDSENLPEEFQEFVSGLRYFVECTIETKLMAMALSRGELDAKSPSKGNEIAAPLKSLQASLKHLTWQVQQIAQGDYKQKVDFMGEFSVAFNTMTEQLAERQQCIENKMEQIKQANILLTNLMRKVPLQIIVIDRDTCKVLFKNEIAEREEKADAAYIENFIKIISDNTDQEVINDVEITSTLAGIERNFEIKVYPIEWYGSKAEVFVVNDVSEIKSKIEELEVQAFQDSLTQLYNRTYGMLMLDSWLHEKRHFVLIFADLDNLKYINDEFGHNDGDIYIKSAAKQLKAASSNAVVCRIGGDEFMLLIPGISYDEACVIMDNSYQGLKNHEFLKDKIYSYSISFGIVVVESDNELPAGAILGIADEKMYKNKKMKRKARNSN